MKLHMTQPQQDELQRWVSKVTFSEILRLNNRIDRDIEDLLQVRDATTDTIRDADDVMSKRVSRVIRDERVIESQLYQNLYSFLEQLELILLKLPKDSVLYPMVAKCIVVTWNDLDGVRES